MEKINRNNYEAWILDYLEGNLGAEERRDLFVFLENNPDLKTLLDSDFSDVVLSPETQSFTDKAELKVKDETQLTRETAEYWMIESVEGNLSAGKQQELDDFVRRHNLEKTFGAYQMVKLKANPAEVFEPKSQLKVSTGIVIPLYVRWVAAAAAIVLIVSIALNRGGAYSPGANRVEFAKQNQLRDLIPGDQTNLADEQNFGGDPTENLNTAENRVNQRKFISHSPDSESGLAHNGSEDIDKDTLKGDEFIGPGNLVNNDNVDTGNVDTHPEDVAVYTTVEGNVNSGIVTEEPYKIVTDAASNFTNREVHFSRDKNTSTNEYVAYEFKLGGFEFERKKSK